MKMDDTDQFIYGYPLRTVRCRRDLEVDVPLRLISAVLLYLLARLFRRSLD